MARSKYRPPPPTPAYDPSLCHYCHKNKINPKDRYFLTNGIQVCKECAAHHSKRECSG